MCYDLEAKQEVHSRYTYLTDTEQVTGYSWINHPFSWVISQVVTRRDWFSLIRKLPYGAARLNRFHGYVVFLCPLAICCRAAMSSASTIGNTANNRLQDSDIQGLFIRYRKNNCRFPHVDWTRAFLLVGSLVVWMLVPQLVRRFVDMLTFRRCISYKVT
jgi:hypothetical protein